MPHLVIFRSGNVPLSVPLRGEMRLGRHESSDVVLDDPRVSRHHALIGGSSGGGDATETWWIRDLGSRHGTRVNGAPITEHRLADGDQIQLGDVLLSYRAEDEDTIVHHQVTAPPRSSRPSPSDRRLRLIYDASQAIEAIHDAERMLGELLDAVLDVFGCERAIAWICDAGGGLARRVHRQREGGSSDDIVVSRAVLSATLDRREAVIIRNARKSAAPRTIQAERILSAMAVPLGLSARPIGFLYVDDRRKEERFDPSDLEFFMALARLVSAALESAERYRRAEAMAEALGEGAAGTDIVGQSPPMLRMKQQIAKYAAAGRANVLIRGESGTGKELVARALHSASPRGERPFVTLNCAAIPETMLESELFGHEKGAFTGAASKKRGKFALADGGTLFLDEIGDLALGAQAKLLRALQEGEIQPLGSERPLRVDVRVLSASHKDLPAEIAAGRFREDLYYRLNVVEIEVPPLRERAGDIGLLAHALLARASSEMGKRVEGLSEAALSALVRHDWPGNVRELKNEMERALINAEEPLVDAHDLSPRLGAAKPRREGASERSLAERFAELEPTEKLLVEQALTQAKGNLSEAARLLGITRMMIRRRVARFGLGDEGDAD